MTEPTGHTIAVYLPPDVPEHIGEQLFEAIADLAAETDHGQPWDLHVAGARSPNWLTGQVAPSGPGGDLHPKQ